MRDLCEDLVKKGHSVDLITFSDCIEERYSSENINGVQVHRLRIPEHRGNRIKRALIELTLSMRTISFLKHTNIKSPDGLVFFSPSIFFGNAVRFAKRKWSIKSFLIIRDIFPDWAVNVGILKKGLIYRFFKYFEKQMLLSSDYIGVESKRDIDHCKDISKDSDVFHFHNWCNNELINSIESSPIISTNKINLIYGGVLGVAQDFISFLNHINEYEELLRDIRIIIVGNGEQENEVKKFCENTEIDIIYIGSVEKKIYENLVKQSQVGLIVLSRRLKANNYPGKTFDYMKYSIPVLAYLNYPNEFGEMIEYNNIGYLVDERKDNLGEVLKEISSRRDKLIEKGLNANRLLKEEFTTDKASKEIIEKFLG